MVSIVAKKSRTSSSFPYLANDQACRSWEGAQPGRQLSWPMYIFHTIAVMLSLLMGTGRGAETSFFLFSLSLVFLCEFKLFREFRLLFCEFGKFCEIHKLQETHRVCDHCMGTGYATGR